LRRRICSPAATGDWSFKSTQAAVVAGRVCFTAGRSSQLTDEKSESFCVGKLERFLFLAGLEGEPPLSKCKATFAKMQSDICQTAKWHLPKRKVFAKV